MYRRTDEAKAKREEHKLTTHRYGKIKHRSVEKGFNDWVSNEEYLIEVVKPCVYCKKVHWGVEKGIGLDRIDNSKGYVSGNILSCCGDCNRSRSNVFTVDEFKDMRDSGERLRRYREALEIINKLQKTERSLDEFIDAVIAKGSTNTPKS